VEDALEAFAKYVKAFPENAPSDNPTVTRLVDLCKAGTPKQVKYASIILAKGENFSSLADILRDVVSNLSTSDFDILVRQFSFLKSMASYANELYTKYDTKIIGFVLNNVLMQNTSLASESDEDWVPYDELESEGKAKVLGLKILLKPLLIQENNSESRLNFAKSLMKLFRNLLVSDGELTKEQNTPYLFIHVVHLSRHI
jgi:hypothetical protein